FEHIPHFLLTVYAITKIVQGIEYALREPDLVGFRVKRPCSTQNDYLNFVRWMPHLVISLQADIGLQIGVKAILLGTLCARFIREITFRHTDIIRAKNTLARTRKRFCQYRNWRNPTNRSHRLPT